ncbi:hypothetical protein NLO413_0572 [Candidatus Neoehrlichia lotoris str. RAC413]|uniref:Uncharacterized protein n=1 Tax=Candidatus Neoehrlichia procyonis str. RAC413 TaxID=1359163 RepID=A0A0F3NMD3_9RICK|nr:hypothetical protein NLO413_0572 [Candidatus Neoehrlichia lotoris str. RAC413]
MFGKLFFAGRRELVNATKKESKKCFIKEIIYLYVYFFCLFIISISITTIIQI